MKPVRFSVALVLSNPENKSEILLVKRSTNDVSFPGMWALPAASLSNGELPIEIAKRVGVEKLNTEIEPVSVLGVDTMERETHILIMMVMSAKLIGRQPDVLNTDSRNSRYIQQQWTSNFSLLVPAARQGGLCDIIFLNSQGIDWKG